MHYTRGKEGRVNHFFFALIQYYVLFYKFEIFILLTTNYWFINTFLIFED